MRPLDSAKVKGKDQVPDEAGGQAVPTIRTPEVAMEVSCPKCTAGTRLISITGGYVDDSVFPEVKGIATLTFS